MLLVGTNGPQNMDLFGGGLYSVELLAITKAKNTIQALSIKWVWSLCSDLSLTKRCHTQISCCMHAFFVLIMSFSVHSLLCSAWAGHLFLRCSNHHIWHLCSLLRSVKKALSYLSVFEFHVILCLEVVCITEWVYLKKSPLSARSPVAADACCSLPSAFSAAC